VDEGLTIGFAKTLDEMGLLYSYGDPPMAELYKRWKAGQIKIC